MNTIDDDNDHLLSNTPSHILPNLNILYESYMKMITPKYQKNYNENDQQLQINNDDDFYENNQLTTNSNHDLKQKNHTLSIAKWDEIMWKKIHQNQ